MDSGRAGLLVFVGLFVLISLSALAVFLSEGGMSVFDPAKLQGAVAMAAALSGQSAGPGAFGTTAGTIGTTSEVTQNAKKTTVSYYCDRDNDGYYNSFPTICSGTACTIPEGCVLAKPATGQGDCKDLDANINPGAKEIAGNGIDENCDGKDSGTSGAGSSGDSGSGSPGNSGQGSSGSTTTLAYIYYCDNDGDSYYGATEYTTKSTTIPSYCTKSVPVYPDCSDSDSNTHPGAVEICDGTDNDCDKFIDEENSIGCTMYYYDGDQDGYGNPQVSKCTCSKPSGNYVTNNQDCKDTQDSVNPGQIEVCNQKDDDCDGQVDEGGVCGATTYYCDNDGDGYDGATQYSCVGSNCIPAGCASSPTVNLDCNDNNAAINPGKAEACNGYDDNCDGQTDPQDSNGCTTYYFDSDKDGYGTPASFCLCSPMGSYTATKLGDCNANTAEANPGHIEVCDGIDNDCDGAVDEENAQGCMLYYYDYDKDTWGTDTFKCLCSAGGNSKSTMYYTATQKTDCNDNNAAVHPGQLEAYPGKSEANCINHIDDDCDGLVDHGDPDCQVVQ